MITQSNLRMGVAACALMLCTVGCNAFNDHPKETQGISEALATDVEFAEQWEEGQRRLEAEQLLKDPDFVLALNELLEQQEEAPPTDEAPADPETDTPPAAKVVCSISTDVTVTTPEAAAENIEATSTLNGRASTTSARWLDDNTTAITTANQSGQLIITIQRQADGSFGLCDGAYTQGDETFTVTGGTITVEQFNSAAEAKVINAGSYDLSVTPSADATKAAQLLLGKAADTLDGTLVSGRYYAESLIVVTDTTE